MSVKRQSNNQSLTDIHSLASLLDRHDRQFFSDYLTFVEKKYGVDLGQERIPISIFHGISVLQGTVLFLRRQGKTNKEIGELLGRSQQNIAVTYQKVKGKKVIVQQSAFDIPLGELTREPSITKSVIRYLKEDMQLSYAKIGDLLRRDERTIWTTYNRGGKQ